MIQLSARHREPVGIRHEQAHAKKKKKKKKKTKKKKKRRRRRKKTAR